MLGELTPCGGGPPIPLTLRKISVGRAPDCDVTISAHSISSRHCELTFDDGTWSMRDVGSRNGTAVNGVRCREQQLMPADVLSFARERFTIHYSYREPVPLRTADGGRQPVRDVDETIARPRQPAQPASAPSAVLGRLVPCGGGDPISLSQPMLLVGRRSQCDIQLPFRTVSSEHCRLEFRDGYWFVEELNSTNGVKVDGVRCKSSCLMPDCVLSIAKLRYQVLYTPVGDEPPPESDPFAMSLLEKAGIVKQSILDSTAKQGASGDGERRPKRWTLDDAN